MRRSTATAIWNGKLKNGGGQFSAQVAKDNCPVSKALTGNVTLELDAKLES